MRKQIIKKRMKREEREEQIIEAAKSLFIEKGYMGATTIELAKRADISEVTLFRYFSSKRELFMAAIEPIMTESIEKIFRDKELPVKVLLEKFLIERLNFIVKNKDLIKILLIENEIHHDLSLKVQIIEKIINMLDGLVIRLEIPAEKRNMIIRMIVGTFISFLFISKKENEDLNGYVSDLINYIEFYI